MEMIKRKWSFIVLVMALFLVGCLVNGCATLGLVDDAPSYLEKQYKGLAVAQETYNTVWGGFKMLYDAEATDHEGNLIVDQETYDKGLEVATAYYDAWQLWMDTVIDHEIGVTGEETVEEKAMAFRAVSLEFLDLLEQYVD